MSDKAHRDTNKRLARMEKRLIQIYDEAQTDIEAKATEYFEQFKKLDEAKRKRVLNGTLTEEEYKRWRKNKLVYGNRWMHQRTCMGPVRSCVVYNDCRHSLRIAVLQVRNDVILAVWSQDCIRRRRCIVYSQCDLVRSKRLVDGARQFCDWLALVRHNYRNPVRETIL
jgi:hypothetical protein